MFVRINSTLILNTERIIAVSVEEDDATREQVFAVYTDTEKFYILQEDYDRLTSTLLMGV